MNTRASFGSDNHAGIHPDVLTAIEHANRGHCPAYGDDDITQAFDACIEHPFGSSARGYAVWGGTAANVLGLSGLLRPYEAVICAETAHIHTDECGAPERFGGTKLLPVPTLDGKLTPEAILSGLTGLGDEHHVQPRVVSLSQATELGTCYTPAEIRAIAELVRARGMYLHIDGARLANAAAAAECGLAQLSTEVGADVLSLGGTKNGAMGAEAVIVARPRTVSSDPRFLRKQGMQLASKMRFVSAQLVALLSDDLWRRNAAHANAMAARLAAGLRDLPEVGISYPIEANAVFATLPADRIEALQKLASFHVWDEAHNQVRWMTAFDTTPADVDAFVTDIRATVQGAAPTV